MSHVCVTGNKILPNKFYHYLPLLLQIHEVMFFSLKNVIFSNFTLPISVMGHSKLIKITSEPALVISWRSPASFLPPHSLPSHCAQFHFLMLFATIKKMFSQMDFTKRDFKCYAAQSGSRHILKFGSSASLLIENKLVSFSICNIYLLMNKFININ